MNYYASHSRGLAASQRRLFTNCPVVTWNRKDVAVIPGSAQRRADLSSGGLSPGAVLLFEALVSAFAYNDASKLKADMLNTPLGYLDDEYRVVSVTIRPGGLQVLVECNSLHQKA